MRRRYWVAAIVLLALAGAWRFRLGLRWTMRVSQDAVSTARYFGAQTNADPKTGVIPAKDVLTNYDRTIRVKDAVDWPRSVVLQNRYTARDIETDAVNFEYITTERVDPRTGAWFEGPHKGDIVFFPRNVQRQTYNMRSNYVPGVPLKFSGQHDVGGLNVYLFEYRGKINLTAAFAGTAGFRGVSVGPGQEIRCADDQFYYRVWVEPNTGTQVQVEEGCMSGDFVYDKATGNQLAAVDRWNGVTSGTALDLGITEAYSARRTYLWAAFYLPGLLLLGSFASIVAGIFRRHEGAFA